MALSPFFTEGVLPFLLVFVVIFAILQKSNILGQGKSQLDALVALVVGLLLIGLPAPRDFIVQFMPWVAVGVSVILVFLILYGFVGGDFNSAPGWMKNTFGILALLFTIGVVLYVGGFWESIVDFLEGLGSSEFWFSALIIVIVLVLMILAVRGSNGGGNGNGSEKSEKDEE